MRCERDDNPFLAPIQCIPRIKFDVCGSMIQYALGVKPLKETVIINCLLIFFTMKNIVQKEQECIPVGCIPPAAVVVGGCLHQVPSQTRPPPGPVTPPGADTPLDPGTRLAPGTPPGQTPLRDQPLPLWTEFLTHASENITLPQTSFAGGNNGKYYRESIG